MFRNSIKEKGEPLLGAASLPRRDSLTQLHDFIRSTSVDGHVSWKTLFPKEFLCSFIYNLNQSSQCASPLC